MYRYIHMVFINMNKTQNKCDIKWLSMIKNYGEKVYKAPGNENPLFPWALKNLEAATRV